MKVEETRRNQFYAKDRKTWRKWLAKNHAKEKNVWLVIYRKASQTPSVYYPEAVEEALCFGWIDSKPNKRDAESRFQFFSRRNPRSKWSKLNKERVKKLVEQDLMEQAGLAMVDLAKKTGTWNALDKIDKQEIPPDLLREFKRNKKAFDHYKSFPPSSRKIILSWVQDAKLPETRLKRIKQTVKLAAKNIRANQLTPSSLRSTPLSTS